jgi:hypothetical protein
MIYINIIKALDAHSVHRADCAYLHTAGTCHCQVAIVTGCNTGLGKETARVLATRGAGGYRSNNLS